MEKADINPLTISKFVVEKGAGCAVYLGKYACAGL